MYDRFEAVIAVKRLSRRSWRNLYEAAGQALGLPGDFGTEKVERSSVSYLNRAVRESGLSPAQIRAEIECRGLL